MAAPGARRVPLPFLRRVCFDCFGRSPRPAELKAADGQECLAFVGQAVRSLDFFAWWYEEELYYFLLLDDFRPPEAESMAVRLFKRELTVRDAVRETVISTGFSRRNPGPDTFVTVVLEQLLGITVQKDKALLEAGKKMYDGYKSKLLGREGKSQSDLVAIAIEHPAFAEQYLARHARRLVGKEADRKWLTTQADRFRAHPETFPELVAEILLSPAYADAMLAPRAKNDHQFLRGLYVDLMDRVPDAQELRNLRNALQSLADTTPLRSVLVRMLLDSGKAVIPGEGLAPDERVRALFRRFLGRAPSATESTTFASMLQSKECSPAQAARALLTSTDYQYY